MGICRDCVYSREVDKNDSRSHLWKCRRVIIKTITNYITGEVHNVHQSCETLNSDGECPHWEPIPKKKKWWQRKKLNGELSLVNVGGEEGKLSLSKDDLWDGITKNLR